MSGFTIPGVTLDPGKRADKVDAATVDAAATALADAPLRTPFFSGQVAATDGTAGSDGYKYRGRLLDRGIPVRSVVKTVEEVRGLILSYLPEVPALDVPAGTDRAAAKAMRDAHKVQVQKRLDMVPEVYRDAPGEAFTWLLVKVASVTRDGVTIAAEVQA